MESRVKGFLLWTIVILLCFVAIPIHLRGSEDDTQLTNQFNNFTKQFDKNYKSEEERGRRFSAFKKSIKEIHRLNSRLSSENGLLGQSEGSSSESEVKFWKHGMPKNQGSAVWGLSSFADMSSKEFESTYLDAEMLEQIEKGRTSRHRHHPDPSLGLSFDNLITKKKRSVAQPKVDWRAKGIVTPVKQQKNCGACWAFSTVETVESMNALAKGELKALSVQQVIDCSKNGNLGCNGGDTCTAIEWMSSRQLATEKEYPTTLKTEECRLLSAAQGVRVNSNYSCQRLERNEDSILEIIETHGPVTVAVDATNWQYYVGGIIQWNCDKKLNHAVQVVGYDQTGETPHYIVRNSWGTSFGDGGYLYIAIGSNLCGIANHVAWLSVT